MSNPLLIHRNDPEVRYWRLQNQLSRFHDTYCIKCQQWPTCWPHPDCYEHEAMNRFCRSENLKKALIRLEELSRILFPDLFLPEVEVIQP